MKRLIFALSLVLGLGMSPLLGQVYHINVSGTIDLGLPAYIERVIGVAEKNNAKAIVLEVNTFGGRVDAATQIKDLLFDTDLQTLAFVNKRAISAGALISLSCRKIGMVEGSSIGAATVVTQDMEKASEKQISYFRAEMGATAERNGRNREIAEGMVDETLTVEGLSEEGKLITLTAKDAVEWQMADLIAPNVHAFLDSMGLGDEEVIYSEETFAEDLVRFFTDPMVSSLLIGLGFLGLWFELQSPGFGFAGIVGVLCLALFFGAQYIINLASSFEIILFAIGVVLLFIELFVTPGFGVMGGLGILCMVSSIFMSLLPNMETVTFGNMTGVAGRLSLTFLLTFLVAVIAGRYLPKTEFWNRISLQEEQRREAGYVSSRNYETYLGKTGIAITPLRPAGTGEFAGERMDVVSEGGFVDAQTPIKIVKVDGYRLVVREEGRRV